MGGMKKQDRYCRQQSAAGGSALAPGKTAKAPAAQVPAVRLLVRVALKTLEDVERLQSEFGSPARRGDRPNATSAQKDGFFPRRDQCTDLIIVSSVDGHARPLLPRAHRCTWNKPDPLPLCIASHIDQHGLAGRQPVGTVVVDAALRPAWVDRAWQRVAEEVAQGRQAFVVVPRIKSSDEGIGVVDLAAELSAVQLAGLRVGMLHGQLPNDSKDATMAAFVAGELDVLVATTVIEVGVDVPNATMMVICDAERFGISQLHQLRGRIGRGGHPGVCLLISSALADDVVNERLQAVAATSDGFELAELDLIQRREGDVLGADQSGARSSLRLLSVLAHADVIAQAKAIAAEAVERDPERTTPGFIDAVQSIEMLAAGDWLELS